GWLQSVDNCLPSSNVAESKPPLTKRQVSCSIRLKTVSAYPINSTRTVSSAITTSSNCFSETIPAWSLLWKMSLRLSVPPCSSNKLLITSTFNGLKPSIRLSNTLYTQSSCACSSQ